MHSSTRGVGCLPMNGILQAACHKEIRAKRAIQHVDGAE